MSGRLLVAGVDCSTQSTKVVVCDAATGVVVRSGAAPEALAAARLGELAVPTLDAGETGTELLVADPGFDPESAAARGMHDEHLDQLAIDHVLGAR